MKNFILVFIFLFSLQLFAQENAGSSPAGTPVTGAPTLQDTVFVFTSPRPLLVDDNSTIIDKNVWGGDILLSNSGVGLGVFYERIIDADWKFVSELFFSPVRNTDELEYLFDYSRYEYIVAGKVNRLYILPAIFGIQHYIDIGSLSRTLRPYIGLIASPTLIWEMPYISTWFNDVKDSKVHYRMGGGVQAGADFGAMNTSYLSIRMRYLYTPFGGNGLESVEGSPIFNFGRFYISLVFGGFF